MTRNKIGFQPDFTRCMNDNNRSSVCGLHIREASLPCNIMEKVWNRNPQKEFLLIALDEVCKDSKKVDFLESPP